MPKAKFFFDAGSGAILWALTPGDRGEWGYPVDLRDMPITQGLREELEALITRYDQSLNEEYPPDPGPWREAECAEFNEAVRQALGRLRAELGPTWEIDDEFEDLHEYPDLDRYLADPAGFVRTKD